VQIEFQDESLDLDIEGISMKHSMFIYNKWNMTVMDLLEGLDRLNPKAMAAYYWLAHEQSGKRIDVNQMDFPVIGFMMAIKAGLQQPADAEDEVPKDESPSEISTPTSTE
jgi:hypothetical protein